MASNYVSEHVLTVLSCTGDRLPTLQ